MADDDDVDNQPQAPASKTGPSIKKRSFSFLDTEDYKGARPPIVERQFLREHVDRLEDEITDLKPFRDKYHETKTQLDVLTERQGLTRTAAAVSSVMLAVGGVGIGVFKDLSDTELSSAIVIGVCSVLLIGCSFLMRVRGS